MNIHDFLLTVGISLTVGLFLGYFMRDAVRMLKRFYQRRLQHSKYFEQDLSINEKKKRK
ncbi:hypothetical protein VISI1226_01920 [Vibrio sinaloensis DSM 21326]|uniref:Uncharacterized protein n=1 Tax=Vibrio sinaloensis DSM 21326 TaxID=945550 RepID=E8M1W1_PHOS4|nr:hypothetical protein VISI1226_01920 [Vibrio sinaloensis DSM 21326]